MNKTEKVKVYHKDSDNIKVHCPINGCNKEIVSLTYLASDRRWEVSHKELVKEKHTFLADSKEDKEVHAKWEKKYEYVDVLLTGN